MKLLIIDTDGVGLSMAWRAVMAGCTVRWFIKKKPGNNPRTGEGFKGIEVVDNFVPSMMWADLVVATCNDDYIERLDAFKKRGVKIFAPSKESANLEINRKAGMEIMKKAGIEIAPYETFKSIKDAQKHVKKTEQRFVFKTLGDNDDKSLTYCSKNAADMYNWMQKRIDLGEEPKGDVMLQTFIEGIEVGVSRFMGSKGWVGQWNVSHEFKKLMSGNHGPNTGEVGTVAYFTKTEKLAEDTLAKLEEDLVALNHLGDTAIGFMVDDSGKPWPTEFTMRLGWPIENMMLGATEGHPVEWMLDAINGKDTTTFKEDIGCCLVMAHKDFPHSHLPVEESEGVPIYGITKTMKKHLHPQGVMIKQTFDMDGDKMVERPLWHTANNYPLVITGYGKDVKQATERAYGTAKRIHIANDILRDDIGEKLEEELPKLHKLGYCLHAEYEVKP